MTLATVSPPATTFPRNYNTSAAPFDNLLAFTTTAGATVTASGYVNQGGNVAAGFVTPGVSRFQGMWNIDIPVIQAAGASQNPFFGSSNEFYQFFLLGSNDPAFANGNAEILAVHDLAATAALRLLPNVAALFPGSYPFPGFSSGAAGGGSFQPLNSVTFQIPFSNQKDAYIFPFVNMSLVVGGTAPSIQFTSWPFTGGPRI
jgi:hypothetical protein